MFIWNGRLIIIEIDENQHKKYDQRAEAERIYALLNVDHHLTTIIRLNLDAYKCGDIELPACVMAYDKNDRLITNINKMGNAELSRHTRARQSRRCVGSQTTC